MRFVSVKSIDRQAVLAWHCMRTLVTIVREELGDLEKRIKLCEMEIRAHAQQNEEARRVDNLRRC